MTEMMKVAVSPDYEREEIMQRRLARERNIRMEAERYAEESLKKLGETERRLLLLQRVAENANALDNFEDALRMATRELCDQSDWNLALAYRVTSTSPVQVECCAVTSSKPESYASFISLSQSRFELPATGTAFSAIESARPVWLGDLREIAEFERRRHARRQGLRCGCIIPVLHDGQAVAIIELFSEARIRAEDLLLSTAQQIAGQLASVFEREKGRDLLVYKAHHDTLTGLPNRNYLNQEIAAQTLQGRSSSSTLSAITIDLDEFKVINDRFGHSTGDAVLRNLTSRLQEEVGSWKEDAAHAGVEARAVIARSGGDEFVIIQRTDGGDVPPDLLARRMLKAMRRPLNIGINTFSIRSSIGLAVGTTETKTIEALIQDSDLAMYECKASGGDNVVTFDAKLGEALRERRLLEEELHTAYREEQFVLEYQPIVSLKSGRRIVGYEALIRWDHPSKGRLSPASFIDVATEAGLITKIGSWVLREACAAAARIAKAGNSTADRFISLNVAPQQLLDEEFPKHISQILAETGADPKCIKLEITESVAISNPHATRKMLHDLRAMGLKISLDDFGTGHSSLSYLRTFPFDVLKIDRSFIDQISDPTSLCIVETIFRLADTLGLTVIAEGIEGEGQLGALRTIGCTLGQGYLFGRSMAEEEAFAL